MSTNSTPFAVRAWLTPAELPLSAVTARRHLFGQAPEPFSDCLAVRNRGIARSSIRAASGGKLALAEERVWIRKSRFFGRLVVMALADPTLPPRLNDLLS